MRQEKLPFTPWQLEVMALALRQYATQPLNGPDSVRSDILEIAARLDRSEPKEKRKRKVIRECTCADHDFCLVHPTDTDSLDPNGPWGPP